MPIIPEIEGVQVVVLGSFNPAIFHPSWFKLHKLIRDEEADNAKLEVTHLEVSIFSIEWLRLQALRERFILETTDSAHYESLRDLAMGVFTLLEHTPITAMGINRSVHYKMHSVESWHEFGHLIAPKPVWQPIMKEPGLRKLVMEDSRTDPKGYVRVTIEPSGRVDTGVFVEVNNHFDLKDKDIQFMLNLLRTSWQKAIGFAESVFVHLGKEIA